MHVMGPRDESPVERVEHGQIVRPLPQQQDLLGLGIFIHVGVPVEMVRRKARDHADVWQGRFRPQVRKLETAQFEHDDVVRTDLGELIQQAAADVSAQPGPPAAGLKDGDDHSGGRRFSIGSGHADGDRRASRQKQVDLCRQRDAVLPRDCQPGVSRPHRRIDHDQISLLKICFAVPTKVECGDRRAGKAFQRRGEDLLVRQIGDGDNLRPVPRANGPRQPRRQKWPSPMTVIRLLRKTISAFFWARGLSHCDIQLRH